MRDARVGQQANGSTLCRFDNMTMSRDTLARGVESNQQQMVDAGYG